MNQITLVLNDKTEYELSSYIRVDRELRLYVNSYDDSVDKLENMTRQNLNGYKILSGEEIVYKNSDSLDVDYVRFPPSYEKVEETDEIVMLIKLRKAIGGENE